MGNFFYKDQNTTINNLITKQSDLITIEFNAQSNEPINEPINEQSNEPINEQTNEQPIIEPSNEAITKEYEIDWDEIERSVEEFVIKIKEMKEKGLFDIRTEEIVKITNLNEDW